MVDIRYVAILLTHCYNEIITCHQEIKTYWSTRSSNTLAQ